MPNYVTNKLEFPATQEQAEAIFAAVRHNDGNFDFNTLIPTPLHIYQGNLGAEDEKDFQENTWNVWNRANWGTKWNALNDSKFEWNNGHASIEFDTAWSVPHPVAVAFGNKFKVDFTLKYFDEGFNFWGVEEYKMMPQGGFIARISKRLSDDNDRIPLHIELKGYHPDKDRDDEDGEQPHEPDQNRRRENSDVNL